ncbi:MAG: hypothetical protein Q8S11_09055 [Daejeonella sp.]|uniref:hypothetical protein n=1 Tax=Daejeonella sp. TaxID=2805397 RepID=UPI002733996C|nr:hypothetical protein [Daejeonella sp.]MDP3468469.1 hypothetical protein [Daejeonella sp.]
MIKPVSIDKASSKEPSMDFDFLRKNGIELIQQLSGKSWTDFNLHDPGLTILEQLCFSITELAYRTDFPLQDLLANEHGKINYHKNAFFIKEDILTTNPVTINDFRKVIIDEIEVVKNVWLYPIRSAYSDGTLSGLYKIVVQVDPKTAEKLLVDNSISTNIAEQVRKCFVAKRNLCEDIINEIIILKPEKLVVEAEIMIEPHRLPEEILAYVFHHLENSLNPPVKYYTEDELLSRGLSIDQIYNGPFLNNGFIPESELQNRKTSIDPTELIKSVSQIEGVLSVKNLKIIKGQQSSYNKPFKINENGFALLDIKSSEEHIKLFKDNLELTVKRPVFRSILQKVRESDKRDFISSFYGNSFRESIEGNYRNNKVYHSIQNQFPKVYGIGYEGLANNTPKSRKAKAKQLKGYLLFFEQIMANYLAQLSNIGDTLSIDLNQSKSSTYYGNPLNSVPDVKYLLRSFSSKYPEMSEQDWENFKKDDKNGYIEAVNGSLETDKTFDDRKNQLFDHLLARFNEFVTPFPVQLYTTLYETYLNENRISTELKWKSSILKNLPKFSSGRFRAFNYLKPKKTADHWDFAAKMRLLLYIPDESTGKKLSAVLDDENISVDTTAAKATFTSATKVRQSIEPTFQNDMPQVLMNRTEISSLFNEGNVIGNDKVPNDAFLIQNQELSILKHALDIKNFRIGPDPAKDGAYVILYKSPAEVKWTLISRLSNHADAMKALKNLIDYIKKVNIGSEGFYLLEHILLRPDMDSKVFGFKFIARNGQNLMEQSKWMTFQEREDVMASLIELLSEEAEINAEKLAPFCKVNLYAGVADLPESYSKEHPEQEDQNLFNYFKIYARQKEKFLSRFQMVVKGEDHLMIREDFFRLNMSVIFPSWPARFQDKSFRDSAENLFRLNAPAHVKINFIWMGLSRMKRFEAWYSDWKRFTAEQIDPDTREVLRNALVHMLYQIK